MSSDKKYFAADEDKVCVEHLIGKSEDWFKNILLNNYLDKLKNSWSAYHGVYYEDAHAISYGGEQGELVNLSVNHYRNLGQHMLNMVTASRPSFKCRAINSDRKSLIQAKLGDGLLDYYMREKRLEREIKKSVEYAIVMGSGYVKLEWNSTRGTIYDYIEPDSDSIAGYNDKNEPIDEDGEVLESVPIYEGDLEFKSLSPFDVVFDPTKETPEQHDWVLCRSFANRYDLIAKYPEHEDKILALESKDRVDGKRLSINSFDTTTDVAVYEFFHKKSEALPNGRYLLYLDRDIILIGTAMPYRSLPVHRIAPSDILGTPYGYTMMFDLLPIQDAINGLYSTILTNQNAFGVQNILNPQGNGIKVNQMEGGMNFLEYNAQVGKPEALQLTQTPGEIFNFLQMLEKSMETISGINSVARGNPEASLKSGNALALVQSQALQFISGLQQSYIQLLEDVGTGIINILKDYAEVPRIASIVGKTNVTKMKEFKSEDLESVNRVVVDVGNALMNSTAGRAQVAENLLQMGVITTPEKYLMVMNTGNLDTLVEGTMNELDVIKDENEALVTGEDILAVSTDHHAMHIREHREVIADVALRRDPDLVQRTLAHIQEHIYLLQNTDPNLLAIVGEQPLGPPQGSPVAPGTMEAGNTPPPELADNMNPESVTVGGQNQALPSMPRPAGEEMLGPQPTTPEELFKQNS